MSKSKFYTLYENYFDEMEVFARRRLGREDARDAVHEVYLRLLKRADPDTLENPRAYLYRITTNVINDFGEKFRNRHVEENIESVSETLRDDTSDPEAAVNSQQILRECIRALDELPEIYRHVFLLSRVRGVPHAQIASTLKIPKRTVERYISRALVHCLERIEE